MAKHDYEAYNLDADGSNESLLLDDARYSTSKSRRKSPRLVYALGLLGVSAGLYTLSSVFFSSSGAPRLSASDLARSTPLLSFSCPNDGFPLTSTLRPPTSMAYTSSKDPIFDPLFLERSRLFEGTGAEVRRVLTRAISGLGVQKPGSAEKPRNFKILILGGSISICHGTPQSECWPNLIGDYFRQAFDTIKPEVKTTTEVINLSQPATGTSYFSYCLPIEEKLRAAGRFGDGPDLIILEFGINDVWPINEVAKKDVERLLRVLRAFKSKPAVIFLDAASLKLATTYKSEENPEALHLPAAKYYDTPLLSVKSSLFGPTLVVSGSAGDRTKTLFQDDLHHPNVAGHRVLLDVLITYIEKQACMVQTELLQRAIKRVGGDGPVAVDRVLDIGGREREVVKPLPSKSLFKLVSDASVVPSSALVDSTCLAVGTAAAGISPILNSGWRSYVQQSDKQYLLADVAGSLLTFSVDVGKGGAVLVDFLRSRSYDLGDVLIRLDDDRTATVAGKWDLDWSIGVPTEVFSDVPEGKHTVSFELLPSKLIGQVTSFRLIAVITT